MTHLFRPLFRLAQGIYSLCKTSFKQLPLCHELPAWLKFSAPIPIPIPQAPMLSPTPMAKPWCQVIGNEVAVIHGGLPCLAQDDSAKPGDMIPVGTGQNLSLHHLQYSRGMSIHQLGYFEDD